MKLIIIHKNHQMMQEYQNMLAWYINSSVLIQKNQEKKPIAHFTFILFMDINHDVLMWHS